MHAQPVAASLAFWIDALNGPAGQILHVRLRDEVRIQRGTLWLGEFCAGGTCVSRGIGTISRGWVAGLELRNARARKGSCAPASGCKLKRNAGVRGAVSEWGNRRNGL